MIHTEQSFTPNVTESNKIWLIIDFKQEKIDVKLLKCRGLIRHFDEGNLSYPRALLYGECTPTPPNDFRGENLTLEIINFWAYF